MGTSKLVHGKLSRTFWNVGLVALSGYLFCKGHEAGEGLGLPPYVCFFLPAACSIGVVYSFAQFVANDDRLTDAVLRDTVLIWLYLFLMAPMISKEMLPPLKVNRTTLAEIGAQVEKGLVTAQHLNIVHEALWHESGRSSVVPWPLARLSSFPPTLDITVPRRDFDHTGRVQVKTKRGKSTTEYDMLQMKFWLPMPTEAPFADADENDVEGEAGKPADASTDAEDGQPEKSADEEKTRRAEKEEAASDGEDAKEETSSGEGAQDTVVAPKKRKFDPLTASYVYLFARSSPKLELWPQPNMSAIKTKKERRKAWLRPVRVCGKLFNGIPRMEAIDEAAQKLDRNLREDPNSVAFSLRANFCPGEPWIFGHSGYMAYGLFLPLYLVARIMLSWYSTTILHADEDESILKEIRQLMDGASGLYGRLTAFLMGHNVRDAPVQRKNK